MKGTRTNPSQRKTWHAAIVMVVATGLALAVSQSRNRAEETQQPGEQVDSRAKVSVAIARDRAKLMHDIYASTLEVMHERYFHGDRAIVPARAMEDVFLEVGRKSKIKARWIAVNTKAMSVNHEPKTDFEKKAAAEIAAGKGEVEIKEDGHYWRAAAIPLADGCVGCHTGFFAGPPKTPRFAALVIGVPVADE